MTDESKTSETAAGASASGTAPQALTAYVVLAQQARPAQNTATVMPTGGWVVAKTVNARDAETAVRAYVDGIEKKDGTYIAVPSRSWRPVKITTKVTTTLVVEEA